MQAILHIESATDICSICLSDGANILAHAEIAEANMHSSRLTLLIDDCMQQAGITLSQLSLVALSKGPGSYTSLRVGASVAKGICYTLDKPLVAIDTLQSLAMAAATITQDANALYCPMIDARRMEVYTALYDANGMLVSPTEAMIIDEQSFQDYFNAGQRIVFCGNGAPKCQPVIQHTLAQYMDVTCSAKHLIVPALRVIAAEQWEDIAYFEPNYFKAPNITSVRVLSN